MDISNTEKKVKRIIWKGSSRERSGKQLSNERKKSSLTISKDDAARKRQRHCYMPKSTSDTQVVAENIDACANLQNDVKKQNLCHPQDMSIVRTNNCSPGPCILPLLPVPNLQDSSSSLPVVLNGTANRAVPGPPVGAVDVGISKSAYYFRVALPGVKKDPGEFSCIIERNGRVQVRGVTTTGATTVARHSRVYTMKSQHLCSPGPFTLSFSLPGPVDPRLFSPNFRSDGIFEGVVLKNE